MAIDESAPPPEPGTVDVAGLPAHAAGLVRALAVAQDAAAALDLSELDGAQAARLAQVIAAATSRLGVVGARLLPVVEADGLWATSGARSFAVWVATRHRVGIRTAREQVRLGRALRDHLPATTHAAVHGEVTAEHAQVLDALAPTTPARVQVLADPDHPCNEGFLVDQARMLGVDSLRLLTRRWAAAADPDADDRGYTQAGDREYLEVSRVHDGYHLAGQLTTDHGQALLTAIAAVTPVPAAGDTRTTTQRRAQGLGDLARLALDHGLTGTTRPVRPHLNVLVDYPTLATLAAQAAARRSPQDAGHHDKPGSTPHTLTPASITGAAPAVSTLGVSR